VTEILNYISAWLGLLTAVLMLNVFLFERASKKNADSLGLHIKKSLFPRAGNKKKSFFDTARLFLPAARSEIWR